MRFFRGCLVGLVPAIAIWILVIVGCQHASAATTQELSDSTSAWISQTLGVPVQQRTYVPVEGSQLVFVGGAQVRCWRPDVVEYAATNVFVDRRGRVVKDAGALMLHENLHFLNSAVNPTCVYSPWLEEGITEALTVDLLPAWSKRFYGRVLTTEPVPEYASRVEQVRAWSARWCGTSWKDRCARLARRQIALADYFTRIAMAPEIFDPTGEVP